VDALDETRLRRLIEVGRTLTSELDLETVLRRVIDVAQELTGARYAALGVLDAEKKGLERFITAGIDDETHRQIGDLPRGRGVLGLLIDDPRPIRMPDVGRHPRSYGFPPGHPVMRSFLGVPVAIRGEAYGNLYLTEKEGGGEFTDEDEEAVIVLAAWTAIAVENARLYQHAEQGRRHLEHAVKGLEVTTSIARAVGGETDLDRVLELIAKRGRALVEARWLWILLLDGDEFVVAAVAGEVQEEVIGRRLPVAGSVGGETLATRQAERIGSGAHERLTLRHAGGMEASTGLIVPLVFRETPVGVVAAFDRTEAGPDFSREDEDLMLSFAASAATAVHTATSVAHARLEHALVAAEQERSRWARELHDETLQSLGALQLVLGQMQREQDPDKRAALVAAASSHVAMEIENLRNLITELRPAELDELGLESALESLANRRAEGDGIAVRLDVDLRHDGSASRRLAPAVESTVYRLVQEALTNVAKHASADQVDVQVVVRNGVVEVLVADDGAGFDPEGAPSGFGIVGMRERVALVNGRLELDAQPGHGTRVLAILPIQSRSW